MKMIRSFNVIPQILGRLPLSGQAVQAANALSLAQVSSNLAPVSNLQTEPDGSVHIHLYETFGHIENVAQSGKEYGPFVHNGTSMQAPQPFWLWGIDQNHDDDVERGSALIAATALSVGARPH